MRKVLLENKDEARVKNLRSRVAGYRKFSEPRLIFSQNFVAGRQFFACPPAALPKAW
jgi:hypothetical protein